MRPLPDFREVDDGVLLGLPVLIKDHSFKTYPLRGRGRGWLHWTNYCLPPKSVCLLDPFLKILFSEKSATSMDSGGDRPFSEVKKAKKHPPSHGKLASGPQIGDMYTFMNTLRDKPIYRGGFGGRFSNYGTQYIMPFILTYPACCPFTNFSFFLPLLF